MGTSVIVLLTFSASQQVSQFSDKNRLMRLSLTVNNTATSPLLRSKRAQTSKTLIQKDRTEFTIRIMCEMRLRLETRYGIVLRSRIKFSDGF